MLTDKKNPHSGCAWAGTAKYQLGGDFLYREKHSTEVDGLGWQLTWLEQGLI